MKYVLSRAPSPAHQRLDINQICRLSGLSKNFDENKSIILNFPNQVFYIVKKYQS